MPKNLKVLGKHCELRLYKGKTGTTRCWLPSVFSHYKRQLSWAWIST